MRVSSHGADAIDAPTRREMTGEWTGWYESGKLKWRGSLAHGRFTGELTSWRANGDQLAHVTSFELAPDAVVH